MTRRIIIWGLGKVGRALYEGLRHSSIGVNVVVGREASNQRTAESLLSGEGALWSAEEVLAAPQNFFLPGDLVFVSVVDREIENILQSCDLAGVTLVHCSGATSMLELKNAHSGVFYPLQSFVGQGEEDWQRVPVFIEGSVEGVEAMLTAIAKEMGVISMERLNSGQRAYLHLAGVFANNYTMAMAGIAKDLLDVQGLNPDWVLPILTKTAENFGQGKPWELLTGPASRADLATIEHHRSMLENQPDMLSAYNAVAQYIINRPKDSSE
jgi:predicted short-subunit dehydrogenase-like oxidoreductase (DUF2520 family)